MTGFSETQRQSVHIAMGAFALALRVLSTWQAAACALMALLVNVLLLPRWFGDRLFRPGERGHRGLDGIVFYPLAVMVLILLFPTRPDIAAAAWGILAVGDGAATLVGRRLGGLRWPWHPTKTVVGSVTLAVAGGAAALALTWWTIPALDTRPSWTYVLIAPFIAAGVAALVESLPVALDDNLSVPFSAAAVLWTCSLVSAEAWRLAWPAVADRLPIAVVVNAVSASLAWRAGTVSRGGAVVGALIGVAVWAGAGPAAWTLLLTTFGVASLTSRVGHRRKAALGIAEDRDGRRGPGNAIANCLVAAVAALLGSASGHQGLALLALTAALTAGASDTAASELGKAWGRQAFLVTRLARVPAGTPGAVSVEGTAAGLVTAFALSALGAALGLIPPSFVWVVVLAATVACFVESALGATLEGPGILNNDVLNFLNTAVSAFVAVAVGSHLG